MTVAADRDTGNPRRVRSVRMHDETWDLIEGRGRGAVASVFINDMAEAGLGFARCYRCFTPVPVAFGNLAGKPLAHWVAVAGKTVTAQKCSAHHPVTIGAQGEGKPATARTEPPGAAPVVFLEPGGES